MVVSYIKSVLASVALLAVGAMMTSGTAAAADDKAAIESTLSSYNAALNGGDTAAVLPLYTEDGIFMPPYSQSAIGKEAVRKAYDDVFKELKFNVKFNIAELVQMAPTWAYVRTNSAGTTAHHSTGRTTSEANQELFIFKKGDDGKWRIARYSFSPRTHRANRPIVRQRGPRCRSGSLPIVAQESNTMARDRSVLLKRVGVAIDASAAANSLR
jgi:uncharacterized protein (TIGR02246 family)